MQASEPLDDCISHSVRSCDAEVQAYLQDSHGGITVQQREVMILPRHKMFTAFVEYNRIQSTSNPSKNKINDTCLDPRINSTSLHLRISEVANSASVLSSSRTPNVPAALELREASDSCASTKDVHHLWFEKHEPGLLVTCPSLAQSYSEGSAARWGVTTTNQHLIGTRKQCCCHDTMSVTSSALDDEEVKHFLTMSNSSGGGSRRGTFRVILDNDDDLQNHYHRNGVDDLSVKRRRQRHKSAHDDVIHVRHLKVDASRPRLDFLKMQVSDNYYSSVLLLQVIFNFYRSVSSITVQC